MFVQLTFNWYPHVVHQNPIIVTNIRLQSPPPLFASWCNHFYYFIYLLVYYSLKIFLNLVLSWYSCMLSYSMFVIRLDPRHPLISAFDYFPCANHTCFSSPIFCEITKLKYFTQLVKFLVNNLWLWKWTLHVVLLSLTSFDWILLLPAAHKWNFFYKQRQVHMQWLIQEFFLKIIIKLNQIIFQKGSRRD